MVACRRLFRPANESGFWYLFGAGLFTTWEPAADDSERNRACERRHWNRRVDEALYLNWEVLYRLAALLRVWWVFLILIYWAGQD